MKYLFICLFVLLTGSCTKAKKMRGSDLVSDSKRKYKIATIVKIDGIAWFSRMREGVQQFAHETGHDCELGGPAEANGALQAELVEKAIRDKVDAIAIVPFDVSAVEPALKKAREKGIVVIAHEASNLVNADYIIEAFRNGDYGAHLMDHLAKYMNYSGGYIGFIGNKGSRSHVEWMDAAKKRQKEKYPNMFAMEEWIENSDDHAITYTEVMRRASKKSALKGVIGGPMSTAAGAGLAVQQLKKSNEISVVSTSLVSVCARHLQNGSVDLISYWDPLDAGYVMNLLAVMALEKKEVKDKMNLHVNGYNSIAQDEQKKNLFYGAAWKDVTKENASENAF